MQPRKTFQHRDKPAEGSVCRLTGTVSIAGERFTLAACCDLLIGGYPYGAVSTKAGVFGVVLDGRDLRLLGPEGSVQAALFSAQAWIAHECSGDDEAHAGHRVPPAAAEWLMRRFARVT